MSFKTIIASLTAAFFFAAPVLADTPDRKFNVKTSEAGIKYISGGVGNQEAAHMERLFGEYSLKVVNVRSQGEGAYVANVGTKIKNESGKTVVDTKTTGPWLLADLQPGAYTLNAQFKGQKQKRQFNIAENGHERVVLKWKGESAEKAEPAAAATPAASERLGETDAAQPKDKSESEHPGKKAKAEKSETKTGDEHSGAAAGSEHPGEAQ